MPTETETTEAVTSDAVLAECVADCDTHYTATTGKSMTAAGLDPFSIITAIFAILAQLCPKPASELKAAAAAKSPSAVWAVTSATRQALREEHSRTFLPFVRFNGRAIADSVLTTIAAKDEAKIQVGLDCCAH